MQGNNTLFVRTCDECGWHQVMKDPALQRTDKWRDAKCRKCKSEALDYGSYGWQRDSQGNLTRIPPDEA